MTVKELMYHSMRLARINLAPGREANVHQQTDALATLNAMLDAWNAERLFIPRITRDVYTLESGKASYSLGPEADWAAARPNRIENVGLIVDGRETPLRKLTKDQWAEVYHKSLASTEPECWYDDRAFPATRIHFYPVPQAAYDVALYTWDQILKFGSLDDTVVFPPGGYEMAVRYGLAVELAAVNPDNSISPLVITQAREYKASVKRLNTAPMLMTNDAPGTCGTFDIYTGDYR